MRIILTILLLLALALGLAGFFGKRRSGRRVSPEEKLNPRNTKRTSERLGVAEKPVVNVSYGEKVDAVLASGNETVARLEELKGQTKDEAIKEKISELILITQKIMQDAIDDPSDIPQIKKFFSYYAPTTIKLLTSYDRLDSQEIEGENIDKSKKNISEMLDVAIEAYKKRLDSLFEDQALDIETDIDVFNQMLEREGLGPESGFAVAQKGK